MKYEITGKTFPVSICHLSKGEGIFHTALATLEKTILQTMAVYQVNPYISRGTNL